MTNQPLSGKSILIFAGDAYEDLELWYPKLRMEEAGATVVLAGPEANTKYIGKNGYPCVSDAAISEVNADDFAGLVVAGGWICLLYTSPSPRDRQKSRMPSSA